MGFPGFESYSGSYPADCLKLLAHETGMDELSQLVFGRAAEARSGSEGLFDESGSPFEGEGLLALESNIVKAAFFERRLQPIPANVAGQVLLAQRFE